MKYSDSRPNMKNINEDRQNALWRLAAPPKADRTDRLSAAVNRLPDPEAFTGRDWRPLSRNGLSQVEIRPPRCRGSPSRSGRVCARSAAERHVRRGAAAD